MDANRILILLLKKQLPKNILCIRGIQQTYMQSSIDGVFCEQSTNLGSKLHVLKEPRENNIVRSCL